MAVAGQWKKECYITSNGKAAETNNGDLTCYVFSLEDAVAHLSITDSSGILTTEKSKKFQVYQNGNPLSKWGDVGKCPQELPPKQQ